MPPEGWDVQTYRTFDDLQKLLETQLPAGLKVVNSKVVYENQRVELPAMGKCISAAANGTTLALTLELTHAVLLVALK